MACDVSPAAVAAAVVLVASLTACGGPTSIADSEYDGVPTEVGDHWGASRVLSEPVVFVDADGRVHLVTRGSSSCPLFPIAFEADGGEWEFVLAQGRADACTDDLAPLTHVFDEAPGPIPETATVLDERGEPVQVDVVVP